MNERQAQHFLWSWSRRRRRGPVGAALIGLAVGAAGGLLFALLFQYLMARAGGEVTVDRSGLAPFFLWTLDTFGPFGMTLSMAAPPFAAFAAGTAYTVFVRQERLYTALLARGSTVPETKPALKGADWAPTIVVFLFAGVMLVGLLALAFMETQPG